MTGRIAFGVKTPIIREGDDLFEIILQSIAPHILSGDIIGITESIVARAQGNYVTLDEIAEQVKLLNSNNYPIRLLNPIYSRNRFALILKAIARATKQIEIIMPYKDSVGNPKCNHPFTGLNYEAYYESICRNEGVEDFRVYETIPYDFGKVFTIDCSLHPKGEKHENYINLTHLCADKTKYGLLGSNRASDEKLKLFPSAVKAQGLVDNIQSFLKQHTIDTEVMIYGDGCFKDPVGGIWEFADPVTSPAYTKGLEGLPNEVKIKAVADGEFASLSGEELDNAIKAKILEKSAVGDLGTTPRNKIDLLASLMDLISGSGDAGTPIVIVRNYTKTFADD